MLPSIASQRLGLHPMAEKQNLETVNIPKEHYDKMLAELRRLRELKEVDWDLVEKFRQGLEDLKNGRVTRVA